MSRRPPPPRKIVPLDRLLRRLAMEAKGVRFDPALPGRVAEAARRANPTRFRRRRAVPAWAVIAAAVLVALGVGTGSAAGRRTSGGPASEPVPVEETLPIAPEPAAWAEEPPHPKADAR